MVDDTPRDSMKKALQVASSIPIIGQPANAMLTLAQTTGYFDKSEIDRLTHKELFYDMAFDAIPVHPELYKDLTCTCTKTGKNNDVICWKKGFIGALDKEQVEQYCPENKRVYETTGLTTRIEDFRNASELCKIGSKYDGIEINSLEDRLRCMHDNLREYSVSGVH